MSSSCTTTKLVHVHHVPVLRQLLLVPSLLWITTMMTMTMYLQLQLQLQLQPTYAFTMTPSSLLSFHKQQPFTMRLYQSNDNNNNENKNGDMDIDNNNDDDNDNININNNDDDDDNEYNSSSKQISLGINIGSQLQPFTPEQAQSLKEEATQKINDAFNDRLQEIESMKQSIRQDFEESKKNLQYKSDLRTKEESEKLMKKIDTISNDFLKNNEVLRMGTKLAAKADLNNSKNGGMGLEVGSWGTINGLDVNLGGGMNTGLLGSVASSKIISNKNTSNDQEEEKVHDEEEEVENRIMIICDNKQVRESELQVQIKTL